MSESTLPQERAGQNQSLFRDVNERVEEINRTLEQVTPHAVWLCECADLKCTQPVELTVEEYEAVRGHANRFVIAPDAVHLFPDVERVVEETDRYWLVEKIEEAAAVAAERDPRNSE